MKKHFYFLSFFLLLSISSWSQTFTQVTTTGGLIDGEYLIIGDAPTGTDGMMINTVTSTPYINYSSTSNPGSTITTGYSAGNVFKVTVTGSVITIFNASLGYVSWGRTTPTPAATGNHATFFNGTVSNNERWTATLVSGEWTLSNVATPARFLQWNTSAPRFACYLGTQIDLKLFRKNNPTVITSAATSISTSSATLNGTVNANVQLTTNSFDYGTSVSYGSTIAATPATLSTGTTTAISATPGSLALNTQYFYRAVGTVSGTPTNGSGLNFYTLAATPGVLVVNNPQLTTIDVAVDATTQNSNPASTEYAIQETTGGLYVQANGSLAASVVWQTAATWATKTVTGLNNATTYTFQTKARNGANVETAFGSTASQTTLSVPTLDYVNLQNPVTSDVLVGTATEVFARVYEAGLTDATSGQAPGISAWIGVSPMGSNTNPNTWTTWIPATFNGEFDIVPTTPNAIDEYKAEIGAALPAGTYYYASRFQLGGGPYKYGGIEAGGGGGGGEWNGTPNGSGVLTLEPNPTQCADLVAPANAATGITSGTVALSWTAPTTGPTPTGYKVYFGTTTNPTTLVATVTTLTYNATANDMGVTYYWKVVPTSTIGGDAASCTEFSFTTFNPAAPFCISTYATGAGTTDGITNVTLGVLNNTSTQNNVSPFYTFYNAVSVPNLIKGSTANVSITFGSGSDQYSAVWIDFNHNDVFEASEGFLASANAGSNGTTVISIPVPASAASGNARMRVRGGDDVALLTSQACGASNSALGETEDYIVNLADLCPSTATWNGSWDVAPTSSHALIFNSDYTHTTATTLEGCSCTINGTSVVTFNDGALNLQNNLSTASGSSLIMESGANLVQLNTAVPNTVLGTFTSKRTSSDIIRLDYTAWSSPVVGQNALAFSPATLTTRFYNYSPTANAYTVLASPSTTSFTAGKGMLVRAPNTWDAVVYDPYNGVFTGVPNNGNVTTSVSNKDGNTTPSVIGYNLLGNPYASPISANLFLDNINNSSLGMTTLYFWTHKHAAVGGIYGTNNYATHNGTGGTPANVGEVVPDGNVQVGQGFLVDVTTSGTAQFNNAMRLTTSNGQFFKTSGKSSQTTVTEKHRMWFGLTSPTSNYNVALVGYIEGATNAFDANFDAKLLEQSNSALYSPINNNKYVIQGKALPFTTSDVVPLGLTALTAGQYTISMTQFDGLFTSQDVFLRDNLLNVTHDIKGSAYTFVSDAGDFASRFDIVYASPLSVETPTFTENSVVVYSNESGININAGQTVIESVKVFDVRGRLLVSKSKVNASSITIENVTADKQVLIVQITSVDNVTVSKKVIN